ncbi:hypothetical protein C6P46_000697 [Rhodotorula mucilaginosa]|uniref:FAM50A/XAP5 C-terminal domain-containing protein n=1 Tax=Rhodotorula mucilaginosa TaxID=5537 RepID=A0A9P7B2R4_RHOMI|nr:hypothetical protein C6P46_000697 [Rhodotorula mucilaginosa]TKA51571.1 hypothetical protein B0A53_05252 [Rhodotorula sp. CCFEE 5036]
MSAQEAMKLAKLEKKRKQMIEAFEAQKEDLTANRNRTGSDRFTSKIDDVQDELKKSTYGLVQLSDFKETREKIEEQARKEAAGAVQIKEEERKVKKKKKDKGKVKLSFAGDDGDLDEEDGSFAAPSRKKDSKDGTPDESEDARAAKRAKLGKNPTVDTHFLPDREREEAERRERDELRKKWLKMQEDMKQEPVEITYSYWDGSGHRKEVTCKKGDTIAQFLEKCRQQFPELRAVSVDNLMYIKEDLIIPHHYTFYDFIVNKYRGKSGPMFNFDVHDDVRLTHDAASHAGKVIERSWYNRNKHIFPASRWELFNPEVIREKYTIHGQ